MTLTQQCFICQKIMQKHEIRMLCLQCKECCLCMDCYSINLEWKNHSPKHLQIPFNGCDEHIFSNGYSIYDIIIFIQYIKIYGFGSWQTIKNQMRRPISVPLEQYIYDFYTLREMQFKLFQTQFRSYNYSDSVSQNNINDLIKLHKSIHPTIKQTYLAQNPTSSTLGEYAINEQLATNTGEGDGKQFVLGSWPLREEMSYEYINKAEYPVMYMKITGNEPKELFAFKLQILQCYIYRLITRHKIKILFLKHGMHRTDGKTSDEISQYYDSLYSQNSLCCAKQYNILNIHYAQYLAPHLTGKGQDEQQTIMQASDQIKKYELSHLYMSRGFATRKDFRTHIRNILYERELRIQIHQLQQQLQCTRTQPHPSIKQNQSMFNKLKGIINQKYSQLQHFNFQNVPLQYQLSEIMRNFRIPGDMIHFMQHFELHIISPGDKNICISHEQHNSIQVDSHNVTSILQSLLKSQLNSHQCSQIAMKNDITICYSKYLLELYKLSTHEQKIQTDIYAFNKQIIQNTQSINDAIFNLITSIYKDMKDFEVEVQINTFNIRQSGSFVMVGLYIALTNLCAFMHTLKYQQNVQCNKTDRILEVTGNMDILQDVLVSFHGQNVNLQSHQDVLLNIFNGTNPILNNRIAMIPVHESQQKLIEQLNCGFMTVDAFLQKNFRKEACYINSDVYQQYQCANDVQVKNRQQNIVNNIPKYAQAAINDKKYIFRPIQLISLIQYIVNMYGIDRYSFILDMAFPLLLGAQWPNNPFFSQDIFNVLRQNRYCLQQMVNNTTKTLIFQQQLEYFIAQIQKYQIDRNSIVLLGNGFQQLTPESTFVYLQDFINASLSQYYTKFIYDVQFLDWYMSNPRIATHSKRQWPSYMIFMNEKKQRVMLEDYKLSFKTEKYYDKRQLILSQQQFVTTSFSQDDYYNIISFLNSITNYTYKSLDNIDVIMHQLQKESGLLPTFNRMQSKIKLTHDEFQKINISDSKIAKNQQVSLTLQELAFIVLTNIPVQVYQRYKTQLYITGCIITEQLLGHLNSNLFLVEACALIILTYDSNSKQKLTKTAQNKIQQPEYDYYVNSITFKPLQIINYTHMPQNNTVRDVDKYVHFYQELFAQINSFLSKNQFLSIAPPSLLSLKDLHKHNVGCLKNDHFSSLEDAQDDFQ